jgi:hypothetical protein
MEQYKILVRENGEEGKKYPLADRSARVVKALRKLQVDTTFYTIQERYNLIKEMMWDKEWVKSQEEKDANITFELVPASMNPIDFIEKVSVVLFPDAPVEENSDEIDHEVAIQALEDFTTRTDRKRQKLNALFS